MTAASTRLSRNLVVETPQIIDYVPMLGREIPRRTPWQWLLRRRAPSGYRVEPAVFCEPGKAYRLDLNPARHTATITEVDS